MSNLIAGFNEKKSIWQYSTADNEIVLANIGDYGIATLAAQRVAALVARLEPDAIFTNGDNSQIGVDYVNQVTPLYGSYVTRGKFWPCPGNHDWDDGTLEAYFDYFSEIVQGRYHYARTIGPVTLFMQDSTANTPDGSYPTSYQADWMVAASRKCRSPWKVACLHYPPYSSGSVHGSIEDARWDFETPGMDLVFSGHNHVYERIEVDGITYIVNGLGGATIYGLSDPVDGTVTRYNNLHGAGLLIASPTRLVWRFFSWDGALVDEFIQEK